MRDVFVIEVMMVVRRIMRLFSTLLPSLLPLLPIEIIIQGGGYIGVIGIRGKVARAVRTAPTETQ
jgi:hypothetical protein